MAKQYKAENAQSKYTKINFFFQDKITEEEDFSTTRTTILDSRLYDKQSVFYKSNVNLNSK